MNKRICTLWMALMMGIVSLSAQLVLKEGSFREVPNDAEIQVTRNTPEQRRLITDDNGELCALIKITVENMIKADRELFGKPGNRETDRATFITKIELEHPNEIWIFLSPGATYMILKSEKYGNCKFDFQSMGINLRSGRVYEAVMVGDRKVYESILAQEAAKGNEIEVVQTGWLIFKSTPDVATVYIDGSYVGETPLSKKLPYGRHAYRLQKPLYHDVVGDINIDKTRVEQTFTLNPAHGYARVTTMPEQGATILVDGKEESQKSNGMTEMLSSGKHEIMVRLDMYQPSTQQVTIEDGQTTPVSFRLQPRFAQVSLQTDEGANILLNGEQQAVGNFSGRLMAGLYDVEIQKAHYKFTKRQIEIVAGRDTVIQLAMRPIYGSLDVITTPMDAEVFVDGKSYGQTPTTISKLLEGTHQVEFRKTGYAPEERSINITENQTATVEVTLSSSEKITIQTDRSGDALWVDGKSIGASPQTLDLSYGTHDIQAERNGQRVTKQIMVSHTTGEQVVTLGFDLISSVQWSILATEKQKQVISTMIKNMVKVEGGTFTMGAQNTNISGVNYDVDAYSWESPTHQVTLSSYYIGKYEVTQGLWQAVMGYTPTSDGDQWISSYGLGSNYPAYNVSWNDIQSFITKLNSLTGKTFRLPTEAEWEYAARDGNKSNGYKYSGSNTIGNVAWYMNNSSSTTHTVGSKTPNKLGVYDMSGNVWEWCSDWDSNYTSSAQTNPIGPTTGLSRVLRGCGWFNKAEECHVSTRISHNPDYRNFLFGFRLVLAP